MNSEVTQKILEKTKEDYEKIAEKFSRTRQNIWPELESLSTEVKDEDKVLDVGCGNGRLFQLFRGRPIEYTGVDNCESLIKEAQEKYGSSEGSNFKILDVLNLDFPNDSFEKVFSIAVLSHLPDHRLHLKALENIYRVLKSNGLLILTVWNLWQLNFHRKSWWRFTLEKWLISPKEYQKKFGFNKEDLGFKDILTIWQGNSDKAVLYYYAFTLKQLEKLVKAAGFKIKLSYYSKGGKKSNWAEAYNIVILAEKW